MKTQWFDLSTSEIEISEDIQYVSIFVGREEDLLKTNTRFIHKTPGVVSNILIKAILFDKSTAEISGDLVIENGAKHVDSYLKIDVLLMSKNSSAKAIPSLEITENDVKGGHGATVGPVDFEQLFYLQSKGIALTDAENILAMGFLQEAIDKFDENVPEGISAQMEKFKV